MFRIYCQFKPNIKRAAGADGVGPRQGRGAWVVDAVQEVNLMHSPVVVMKTIDYPPSKVLCLCCPTPRQPGTRCNPRKLLAEYQAVLRG